MRAVLFGGTAEGRELSCLLAAQGWKVTACVATAYGREEQEREVGVNILTGTLSPGEKQRLTLSIRQDALYTYHEDGTRAVEKGSYTLWVGGGQPDARTQALTGSTVLKASFRL